MNNDFRGTALIINDDLSVIWGEVTNCIFFQTIQNYRFIVNIDGKPTCVRPSRVFDNPKEANEYIEMLYKKRTDEYFFSLHKIRNWANG